MSKTLAVSGCACALWVAVAFVGCESPPATQGQPAVEISEGDDSTTSTGASDAQLTLVNTVCPIMGGQAKSTVTTDWNGKTVGFCCPECIPEWKGLTGDEQAEKLTASQQTDDPQASDDSKSAT